MSGVEARIKPPHRGPPKPYETKEGTPSAIVLNTVRVQCIYINCTTDLFRSVSDDWCVTRG